MEYGTLTTGKPDWLKQVKSRVYTTGGKTYDEGALGTLRANECLIVRDYVDLTNGADDFDELLCVSDGSPVFVDLGDAPKGHNLMINTYSGTVVYVNDRRFNHTAGIKSLGDGSWGVVFDNGVTRVKRRGLLGWIEHLYRSWLDEVYQKLGYMGQIEVSNLHRKSFWHLIFSDLPKGEIISKKSA